MQPVQSSVSCVAAASDVLPFTLQGTLCPFPPQRRPRNSLTYSHLEMNMQWLLHFVTEVQGRFTVLDDNVIRSSDRGDATLLFTVSLRRRKDAYHVCTREYTTHIHLRIVAFVLRDYLSIYLFNYLSIYLWLYSPFVGPWPLFQFLDLLYRRSDSMDWGSARRKAASCTQDSRKTLNGHRHPSLKCDSNPRSQCLSGRRHFMP
jgi:hypothetical protein